MIEITAEQRVILEKRAVDLAKKEVTTGEGVLCLEVTSFNLGKEMYALESGLIKEVIPLEGLTPLPCVPPFIAGIMNVRGNILSLVDMRSLLGLPGEYPENCKVIILSEGTMEFGLVVDAINAVITIPYNHIQESIGAIEGKKFIKGVTADRQILLDGAALLTDPHLVINESMQ